MREIKKQIKKQIQKIEEELIQKKGLKVQLSNEIRILTEDKEKLKKKLLNLKNKEFITDHCLIRYIERIYKFDFSEIKKEIMGTKGLTQAILMNASGLKANGREFIIRGGKVITIY